MRGDVLVSRILDDEGLTAGLNDPEARVLVEWLIARAELVQANTSDETAAAQEVERLCRRARLIRRFVSLWCHRQDPGAAAQLVATERLAWPLPASSALDPCEVIEPILAWEAAQADLQRRSA